MSNGGYIHAEWVVRGSWAAGMYYEQSMDIYMGNVWCVKTGLQVCIMSKVWIYTWEMCGARKPGCDG